VNAISEDDRQDGRYAIRYVTANDADLYRRILENTSSRDRYYRFFHHIKFFDEAELARYVEPRANVVNVIAQDGSEPLGVAQAVAAADGSAEFAAIVAGFARRRGVAASLLGRVIGALRARGTTRLVALSLADNEPFARLARGCGMKPEPKVEDGVVTWSLDLTRFSENDAALTAERATNLALVR
jgi:RimJ/RimL family protein N-acetyltransferase